MSDGAQWYAGLEPDLQAFVTARGLDKLDPTAALAAAVKGHANAEKMINQRTEGLVRIPADANDPSFREIYEKVTGLVPPPKAEDYKFDGIKFKDGADLAEEDATFVRDLASRHKLSPAAARDLAAGLAARADGMTDAEHNAVEMTKAANQVALRSHFGGAYDEKTFAISKVAEYLRLSPSVLEHIATLPPQEYVQNMEALAQLSTQLNEAAILRGGSPIRNQVDGYTPEMAEAELERLKMDREWGAKALVPGTPERQTLDKLNAIVARARVDYRMQGPR